MSHPSPPNPALAAEVEQIYNRRFNEHLAYRNTVWQVLTSRFFATYVSRDATVLDLGCGYGEFINNISCGKKFAMDLNPTARRHLAKDVTFLEQDCSQNWQLPDASLDVVFTSNFFEHLASKQALSDTVAQAKRCLKSGGRLIAMGPNIRYTGGAYWDFLDHHVALTDRSLTELLEIQGLRVDKMVDRFLPYTMVNARPVPVGLIALYLRFPPAWKIMGRQFLVIASKP